MTHHGSWKPTKGSLRARLRGNRCEQTMLLYGARLVITVRERRSPLGRAKSCLREGMGEGTASRD